jgi:hypothetical protein
MAFPLLVEAIDRPSTINREKKMFVHAFSAGIQAQSAF